LTGETGHNDELSANRAKAAMNHLITKGIAASKFQPSEPIALGNAPSGPSREDKRDRAVTLNLKFPITIEDLYLYTDDWTHRSDWDDIVGMDTADHGKSICRMPVKPWVSIKRAIGGLKLDRCGKAVLAMPKSSLTITASTGPNRSCKVTKLAYRLIRRSFGKLTAGEARKL
jgi:hypothetical protein